MNKVDMELLRCVWHGDFEGVRAQLAHGGDCAAASLRSRSLLHLAIQVSNGDTAIVEALIHAGASVDARDAYGDTPLTYAALRASGGCCELLIAAGADVNAVSVRGDTPLHDAALGGSMACVALLLAAGGDVRVKNHIGWSPADGAEGQGHNGVAALLHDAELSAARWDGVRRLALTLWCSPPVEAK